MATTSVTIPAAAPELRGVARSQWRLAFERFSAHRPALAGVIVLTALSVLCATASLISPYDPDKTQLLAIYEPPSLAHPFGTDDLGRDLATRILYGGRVSLTIGLLAVTVAITMGTLVGVAAGYYGGWIDSLLMRFVDALYSFPRLFLLILFGVFFKGMTVGVIILVLGLLSWLTTSRLVRATFLSIKQREFVEAARSVGARDRRIISINFIGDGLRDALDPRHVIRKT